jgi:hypothetical protein
MSLPRDQLVYKRLVGAVHMPQFVGDPSDQLAGRGVQRFQLLSWLLIFSAASLSSGSTGDVPTPYGRDVAQ